jgi:hypothetical protein
MQLRITIDIFSGRRNPSIEVDGKRATEILDRLAPERAISQREVRRLLRPHLGYRGLIIEQIGARSGRFPQSFRALGGAIVVRGGAQQAADRDFEDWLFSARGPLGKFKVTSGFPSFLAHEVARFREAKFRSRHKVRRPPRCRCAPEYEPAWWNDGGQKQFGNNCYNYATNYRTDTFAQPGRAAGAMYTALTCASVRPAAVADDLIAKPSARNRCPEDGHLVALVIAPGFDFHWYRKGENGLWTHKPGGTPATNVDNSGHLIPDPRTADRGPYTNFCTFMVVKHGHIKIN